MTDIPDVVWGPDLYDDDSGTSYTPYLDTTTGMVGYRCERSDGQMTHIYFNPSLGSDDNVATVFVYIGAMGGPSMDGAVHHYEIWEDR